MPDLYCGNRRHTPGEFRDEPVWVGIRSRTPAGAEYVAPDHSRINSLMDDLAVFCQRNDIQPLVHTSLARAQFETIHPFSDGNGGTGRALAQAMLRHRGLTRNVAVPVSAGLLANVDGYYTALGDYRNGNIDPIVRQFAAAGVASTNIYRALNDLQDQGILASKGEYLGPMVWRAPAVLQAIDRFAERAGRRSAL